MMDLSKLYGRLDVELLIAKLHGYAFGQESLMFLLSYLSNRWQRTKINTLFNSWKELLQGVPQGFFGIKHLFKRFIFLLGL